MVNKMYQQLFTYFFQQKHEYIPVVCEKLLWKCHGEVGIDGHWLVEVHNGLVDTVNQQMDLAPKEFFKNYQKLIITVHILLTQVKQNAYYQVHNNCTQNSTQL